MAVPIEERPRKYQSVAESKFKPVILSFCTDDDIAHIAHGFDSKTLRKKRLARWLDEAFNQGALLTQLDLAVLLGVCDAVVSQYVNEIQPESKRLLPTRGDVHDLSGAITHKREIITLLPEKLRRLHSGTTKTLDSFNATDTLHPSGETEASPDVSGEQLAKG